MEISEWDLIRFFNGNNHNQIRIGIQAPKDVEVHREEIQLRVDAERGVIP